MSAALPDLPKAFAVRFEALEEWSVRSFFSINWKWADEHVKPLADALERKRERVDKDDHTLDDLQLVTIRFDGSMEPRDMSGKKRFKGTLYFAEPGDVVYSKIDVRNGAIGVVPDELGRVAVSTEFPVYRVRPEVATPRYVRLVFRTRPFRQLINSMISGASGRKRVKPVQLESIEVPLPPLPVQRAIVTQWQAARAEAQRLRAEAEAVEESAPSAVLKAMGIERREHVSLPKCFALPWKQVEGRLSLNVLARVAAGVSDFKTGDWPTKPLGVLCKGRSGSTPRKRTARYWGDDTDTPWVSPKDMKVLEVTDAEDHITAEALKENAAPLIPTGSILIVVRSGILQRMVPVAINRTPVSINQDLRAFVVQEGSVLPDFLAIYLLAKQRDLLRLVKSSTTVQSINREGLEEYPIPLPPESVQREVIEAFRGKRHEAARLRAEATCQRQAARKKLEALILGTEMLAAEARL